MFAIVTRIHEFQLLMKPPVVRTELFAERPSESLLESIIRKPWVQGLALFLVLAVSVVPPLVISVPTNVVGWSFIALQLVLVSSLLLFVIRSLAGAVRRVHTEVEERKETERSLVRRERQLMLSLQAGKIGVWELDLQTRAMTWSDKVESILGLSPGMLGSTFGDFLKALIPEDRAFVEEEVRRVISGDVTELYINPRILLDDGGKRWLEGKGSLLRDGAGNAVAMMGTVMDVTERANAQLSLHRSEVRFRSLVQRSNDVILVCDTAGKVSFISPSIVPLMGYREEECLGRSIFEFIHKDDLPRSRTVFEELIAHHQEGKPHETRIRHADGSYRIVETVGMNLLDQAEIHGLLITARDVTDRKKEEASIEAIAAGVSAETGGTFFRSMVQHLAEALEVDMAVIGDLDPVTAQTATTEAVWKDGAWEENFEFSIQGSPCAVVFEHGVHVVPRGLLQKFPEDGLLADNGFESFAGILLGVPDGSSRGILAVFCRRPIHNVERVRSFLQILAARAAAELERTRSEERLRESLQEKEVLLKEIHHRVKNNLQVISSLLNLQSEFVADPSTKSLFRESQSRIRSMGLIHENLYRAGDLARVPAREYLRSLATSIQRSYGLAHVQLTVDTDDVYLSMDEAIPVGLIVNELVSNAFKHAFPGEREGAIEVRLHAESDTTWELAVGDNGVGLPDGLSTERQGSLGLQLVHTLVRQLAGEVDVERNRGTRFVITFAPSGRETTDSRVSSPVPRSDVPMTPHYRSR